MSKRSAYIIGFVLLLALFFGLHWKALTAEMGGTAHGQQGANVSLAQSYVENGLSISSGRTHALNSASQNYPAEPTKLTQLTAVPFPIHANVVALIHNITGFKLSVVYRVYTTLWGFVGLFFVYLLALRITDNIGKSLFVLVFIGTAPMYAFFQSNFLPEIPSMAMLVIGLYFLYNYLDSERTTIYNSGLLFFLLAALCSPDFVLYLFAAAALVTYHHFKRRTLSVSIITTVSLPIGLFILAYIAFFNSGNSGSQFPGLFQDWNYSSTTANFIFTDWKMHYFTIFQTVTLFCITGLLIFSKFRRRIERKEYFSKYRIIIVAIPGLIYAFISPYQALYSEVFFLKSLFLIVLFFSILIVDSFDVTVFLKYPIMGSIVYIFLILMMVGEGNWTQTVRHEKARMSYGAQVAFAFKGGDVLLCKHNVTKTDVIEVVVPNGSGIGHDVLLNLHHSGLIREIPIKSPDKKFGSGHYVLCTLQEKELMYEHFRTNFQELGNNGSIVLFKVID